MPNVFNQLLAGLSGGFTGYAQDQDQKLKEARQATLDTSLGQERASQNALRVAQVQNFASEDAARQATAAQQAATAAAKALVNKRAYNALAKAKPDHPLVGVGYDDNTDYMGALKELQQKPTFSKVQKADGTYTAINEATGLDPSGQPVQGMVPKDPNAPPPMSEYQGKMLELYQQRLKASQDTAARRAAVPTPDQVKSRTVESLATPAADILSGYFDQGGAQGAAPMMSKVASHIPLIGGKLSNMSSGEQSYQNAMTAARTLATQYLEIMPKSRFQPSTVDDIMQQIAPEPGKDSNAALRLQKAARVKTLRAAIQKRAALRPDAPTTDLTDIPQPPGTDQP